MKALTKIALTIAIAVGLTAMAHAQTTTINWNFTDLDGIFDGGYPSQFFSQFADCGEQFAFLQCHVAHRPAMQGPAAVVTQSVSAVVGRL